MDWYPQSHGYINGYIHGYPYPRQACQTYRQCIGYLHIRAKNFNSLQSYICKGDMSQNSKTAKMVLGRIQHAIISPQNHFFAVFEFWLVSPLHSFVNCWSFLLWLLLLSWDHPNRPHYGYSPAIYLTVHSTVLYELWLNNKKV